MLNINDLDVLEEFLGVLDDVLGLPVVEGPFKRGDKVTLAEKPGGYTTSVSMYDAERSEWIYALKDSEGNLVGTVCHSYLTKIDNSEKPSAKCPDCQGSGTYVFWYDTPGGGADRDAEPCDRCNGLGYLSKANADDHSPQLTKES